MGLAAGDRLDAYEILGTLGAGGMGEVYRARDPRLGREVAIKVLPDALRADVDRLRRFEQEARAAGALDHPSVLAVHDLGEHGGAPYLVTELLEGETLRDRIQSGPIPWRKALEWAREVAAGLSAAHDKGIVHRDLKPENLFVTRAGRVKILDFGLAKALAGPAPVAEETLSGTQSGAVMGTAGYMAPEQVRGRPADARSDIFSLGAVLYEMLAAKRAFEGQTAIDRAHAILNREPAELEAAGVQVPPAVERVVRRCLEKAPDERFQSARDLAFALEALAEGSTPRGPAVAEPTRGRPLGRVVLLLAAAVALAAAGFVAGRAARRPARAARAAPPAAVPRFTRVTYRSGVIGSARFADAGHRVVYGGQFEGEPTQVFVSTPGQPEARPLTEPWTALFDISPQGDMALAVAPPPGAAERRWALAEASLAGGAPRAIASKVAAADYGPDGTLLLVRANEGRMRLEVRGKVLFETDGEIMAPRFSPSGDAIAFLHWPIPDDDRGTVELVDLDGARRTLSGPWFSVQSLAWGASGDEVWFTAGADPGSMGLRAVTRDGRERLVLDGPGPVYVHDIAPDGRVLLTRADSRFRTRGLVPGRSGEVSLSWFDGSLPVDLTPDGRLLLFDEGLSASGREVQVYLRATDGSPAIHLAEGYARALSPDGQWAILSPTAPFNTLQIVPTGPGESRTLPAGPFASISSVSTFSDARRLLIFAREPARQGRLYVQDLDGGPPRPVGDEALVRPTPPSPDGKWAAATRSSDREPVLISLETGEARPLEGLQAGDQPLQWSADGRSLFVASSHGNRPAWPVDVFTFDVRTHARAPWRSLAPGEAAGVPRGDAHPILITPDGRWYVYKVGQQFGDLYVASGIR